MQEQSSRAKQSLKAKCAIWLNAPNSKACIDQHLEEKIPGTCEWIWTHQTYIAWTRAPDDAPSYDRMLLISGQPGCGKTVLASSIADALSKGDELVLFFSFSSTDANRQSLTDLVRSFIWQLLHATASDKAFHIVEELMSRGHPHLTEFWSALNQITATEPKPVYWVIDGLDECEEPISTIFPQLIAFSSRRDTRGVALARQHAVEEIDWITHVIKISPDLVQDDIDTYIRLAIQNSRTLSMPDMEEIAFKRLHDGSQGMFLWVKLMVDDLGRPCSKVELMDRLYSLPQGLQKAYIRTISRLVSPLDRLDRDFMCNLLALVISARRPLKIAELQYFIAMANRSLRPESSSESLSEYMVESLVERMRYVCGPLLDIRHGVVSIAHLSVREFLTRSTSEWYGNDECHLSFLRIDLERSHILFGLICLEYLANDDYGFPLSLDEQVDPMHTPLLLEYASANMAYHFNRAGDLLDSAIYERFRKFSSSTAFVSWIECLIMHCIGDNATLWEVMEAYVFISQAPDPHYKEQLSDQVEGLMIKELEHRTNQYGSDDWRTEQLSLILKVLNPDAESELNNAEDHPRSNPATSTGQTTNTATIQHTSPNSAIQASELLGILESNSISLPRRLHVFLKLQSGLNLVKAFANPLDVLCNMLLRNAFKLPTLALLGIWDFLFKVKKYETALVLCSAALTKEEKRNGL